MLRYFTNFYHFIFASLRCSHLFVGFFAFFALFSAILPASAQQTGILFGNENAPVTVIEYASLSCPHCSRFHVNILPKIKKEYLDTGIAKIYVRDFPHNDVGVLATLVLRCAPESSRAKFFDLLMRNQSKWLSSHSPKSVLKNYAKFAGMTGAKVEQCLQDKAMVKTLLNDIAAARKEGVRSIPVVFINDKKINSDYKSIARAIEAAR